MNNNVDFEFKGESLKFSNLNFKLAVLQQLMFEKKIFLPEYDFEDLYTMAYAEEADYNKASELYAQRVLHYFEELSIPSEFAKDITHIHAAIDDEIYYKIYPEWTGSDIFNINRISQYEVLQFPKLTYLSFWNMSDNVKGLKEQLKPLNVDVYTGSADGGKRSPLWLSASFLLIPTMICGLLSGYYFFQRYGDVKVTTTETYFEQTDLPIEEDIGYTPFYPTEEFTIPSFSTTDSDEIYEKLKKELQMVESLIAEENGGE